MLVITRNPAKMLYDQGEDNSTIASLSGVRLYNEATQQRVQMYVKRVYNNGKVSMAVFRHGCKKPIHFSTTLMKSVDVPVISTDEDEVTITPVVVRPGSVRLSFTLSDWVIVQRMDYSHN